MRNGNGRVSTRPAWKRIAILGFGWLFVVLGVAGLFLPFLQGFLFLFVGLYLLALESARVRLMRQRARRWLRDRYPRQMDRVEAIETKAKDWIRKRFRGAPDNGRGG